jgi:hypothetical protein
MKLLSVAAVLAAVVCLGPSRAPGATCTVAGARQLVASLVGPGTRGADKVMCHDFTGDGRPDLAVTIASGGTAGDVGFVVFRSIPFKVGPGWQVVLNRKGYKLGLFRVGDDLVGSQPIYRKNDPNCCPTGGFDHLRFHWNGKRFIVARSWHTRSFHP